MWRELLQQIQGFDDLDLSDYAQDVADFMASYANLCQAYGGEEEVRRIQQEIKFQASRGADLVVAIAESFEHFKRKYGIE